MAKSKKDSAPSKPSKQDPFAAQLADLLTQARALEAAIGALDFAQLTDEERLHTNGRLRAGEAEALESVLSTVDAHPGLFVALATRDHGTDAAAVETAPARAALTRAVALLPLRDVLEAVSKRVGDEVLAQVSRAKDVTIPAYAIIKANAVVSPAVRKSASGAIDFHAGAAKRSKPKAKKG